MSHSLWKPTLAFFLLLVIGVHVFVFLLALVGVPPGIMFVLWEIAWVWALGGALGIPVSEGYAEAPGLPPANLLGAILLVMGAILTLAVYLVLAFLSARAFRRKRLEEVSE